MSMPFSVFCDFDGTITKADTIDYLLEKLADPSWQDIEARWSEGEIGSRECLAKQIPLIKGGWNAVLEALEGVELDPTFAGFAAWCHENGMPLFVVSEGLIPIVHALLKRDNIHVDGVWANDIDEHADGSLSMKFPYAPQDKACQAGLCKCQVLNNVMPVSSSRIVIGDGQSDLCWATEATLLFAKSKLLKHCQYNNIPHIPFENFTTIQQVLAGKGEVHEPKTAFFQYRQ